MTRRLAVLLILLEAGCYQAHERASDGGTAPRDGGVDLGLDVGLDLGVDVGLDATPDTGGRLCGCPGASTARVCVLPLMCCPATETCEDPAHFSCTGSNPCP